MTHNIDIKKDRLRYTKNTFSATFCYFAILFNVFYFVSIYNKDVGNYYYSLTIGVSVICNLLFLLATFLCSEGVKGYKLNYSVFLLGLGAFQIIRIFGIPLNAFSTTIFLDGKEITVMGAKQFFFVCLFLVLSAVCCFVAGAIGIEKTKILRNYEKQLNS